MSKRLSRRAILGAGLLFACMAFFAPAHGADLQSAKKAGQVGERLDGYLGLVDGNAPADVKKLVKDINAKRRAQYQRIAKQNKVNPADVGKLTAQKVIKSAPKGTFVQSAGGGWTKK